MTPKAFTVVERAVLYARVSGDDTKKEGRNIKGQLEMARTYATEKGYRTISELAEDERKHTSGEDINLPQLNNIRDMAHSGLFDVLVVRELDRLSRNLAKQLIVEEELRRCGVRVEYVLVEYDDTPEGRLQKHIRATVAEFEREKSVERMTRGKRYAVKDGNVFVANRAPYGYQAVVVGKTRTLEVVEEEARIVRLIFQWYVDGVSMYEIARRLSEMGVPTFSETGGRAGVAPKKRGFAEWGRDAVYRILTNETYRGVWRHGKRRRVNKKWINNPEDQVIEVKVPAIVSQELWDAAQLKLQENKEAASRNTKNDYLLSHRVTCGACGRKMVGQSSQSRKKLYLYYCCQECGRPFFRTEYVDHTTLQWLDEILSSPEKVWEAIENHKREREIMLAPLRLRLEIIEDSIRQNWGSLQKTLDLLVALERKQAEIAQEVTLDGVMRLEKTIRGLEDQKQETIAKIREEEQGDALGVLFRTHSRMTDDMPPQVMEITVEGKTVREEHEKIQVSRKEAIVGAGDTSEVRLVPGPETTTEDGCQERAITIYTWEEALKLHQQEFEEERKTFEGRRRLIEKYDIRVMLTVEDGQKFVNVRGKLGEAHLPIALHTTSGILTLNF